MLFQIKQAKMDSGAKQSLEQRDLSVSSVNRPPTHLILLQKWEETRTFLIVNNIKKKKKKTLPMC